MEKLSEMMKKLTPEQRGKVKGCSTTEEILAVTNSEGIEITVEQAEEILKMVTPPYGVLSDEEIDNVAGGQASRPTLPCRACQEGNCIIHGTFR